MIILGDPNDHGVFGSCLLSSWQSDNSICNGTAADMQCGAIHLHPSIVMGADPIGLWVQR